MFPASSESQVLSPCLTEKMEGPWQTCGPSVFCFSKWFCSYLCSALFFLEEKACALASFPGIYIFPVFSMHSCLVLRPRHQASTSSLNDFFPSTCPNLPKKMREALSSLYEKKFSYSLFPLPPVFPTFLPIHPTKFFVSVSVSVSPLRTPIPLSSF